MAPNHATEPNTAWSTERLLISGTDAIARAVPAK